MSSYLASHPAQTAVLSGVLVFTSPKPKHDTGRGGPAKILLLQRASHDFMPNLWETPGGSVDSDDVTILHGAARELWEEAGLRVTAFRSMVGGGEVFGKTGSGAGVEYVKLSFWADVEGDGRELVEVKIDPDEHQRLEIEFTSPAQRNTILEGFRVWKTERDDSV